MLQFTTPELQRFRERLERNLAQAIPCATFMRQPDGTNRMSVIRQRHPGANGIYIFRRIADGRELYVGSADTQDLAKRLQQHLQKGSGGNFRINVMEDLRLSVDEALRYIRDRTELLIAETPADQARVWEAMAILLYRPLHNR